MFKSITNSLLLAVMLSQLPACASISKGSHQNITIETTNDTNSGKTQCNIKNEEGDWATTPGAAITIHRDGNEMEIQCENGKQSGVAHVTPKFDNTYLMMDFVYLDACILSCVIDGFNNAFYEYPAYISVPMQDGMAAK